MALMRGCDHCRDDAEVHHARCHDIWEMAQTSQRDAHIASRSAASDLQGQISRAHIYSSREQNLGFLKRLGRFRAVCGPGGPGAFGAGLAICFDSLQLYGLRAPGERLLMRRLLAPPLHREPQLHTPRTIGCACHQHLLNRLACDRQHAHQLLRAGSANAGNKDLLVRAGARQDEVGPDEATKNHAGIAP